ncbi:VWA domain-containing protein [Pseudosulfitobacter pseudonitzschiae]|uniref:von Willebrand factor type A domain protein n=1 Tax=Pseudosulfitobacter pseudonitzschiae TaxID=1402135 RepID=A0A221K7U9_9RHOB|nr:VWA domain-containing protein [Pseudosulfitobacter pseudonitzschiae]ASM75081.1 von Willebrand factor type A domain protein [Pseudosulfitobacter pseudonitzschiae]
MKKITVALSVLLGFSPFTASAAEGVVIVYDGSNSMWGQIDGVAKIETAREVMADLVETWPQSTNLGLLAYGHRRKGDCSDIELMIPPGPVDRASFLETVNAITPRGKTPLTDAVVQAAKNLSFRDNPATVVLISDGIESCQADPCSISAQLEEQGIAFTTHVIGFDIAREDQRQLSCIAENTGGTFVPAQDANELRGAIAQVQQVIEAQPESVPSVEPEPEPKQEVSVSAPKTVVAGTLFDVSWSEALNPRDLVLIALVGSEADAKSSYLPVRDDTEGKLTAPSEPGLYEVRYRLDEGRVILASAPVEVVAADVSVTAPVSVVAGTVFDVSWSETLNARDLVLIAPVGSEADAKLSYLPVRDDIEGKLTAPSEPGLYEVRYRLDEGRVILASAPVEVVAADVSVTAPVSVVAGTVFDVSWSETLNARDLVLIAPVGSEADAKLSYLPVRDDIEGKLTAPSEPGLYEVRYRLDEGRVILASAPVEVTVAEVALTAPALVRAETEIQVSWQPSVNPRDLVLIAPAGSPADEKLSYAPARTENKTTLKAPSEPGLYEVRYRLDEGRRVIAAVPLEVVPADAPLDDGAGLNAPESAAPSETITVSWTIAPEDADRRVALAKADAPDFTWISAHPVGAETETEIILPNEPGLYEVRFLDLSIQSVLGRTIVAVGE